MPRPQTNCLAVRGITSLLLQTLTSMTPGYPEVSATLHHTRDQQPVFVPGRSVGARGGLNCGGGGEECGVLAVWLSLFCGL